MNTTFLITQAVLALIPLIAGGFFMATVVAEIRK